MRRFKLSAVVTSFVAVAVAAGSLLVPEPAEAGQALFRSVRTWWWLKGTWGGTAPAAYNYYVLPPVIGTAKAPPATGYVGTTASSRKISWSLLWLQWIS